MILVMKNGALEDSIKKTSQQIQDWGHKVTISKGEHQTVIGIIGDKQDLLGKPLQTLPEVEKVLEVSAPYKKASREFKPNDTVIEVEGIKIGGGHRSIIAGPCSVDTYDNLIKTAKAVKKAGATMLRGGAFKPRTSPYSFQGLGVEGLRILHEVGKKYQMPVVSELTSIEHIDLFLKYVDIIQIGARNMQNFHLLKAIGKTNKPILLKRGFSNTIEEWLMSAEYILSEGNPNVILCERGIRTFEPYTRNTLDISTIPIIKKVSHLPIIIDPSHAAGKWDYVESMSLASIAAGADGLMIEVHHDPENAWSDGAQSLKPNKFEEAMKKIEIISNTVGRKLAKQ